MKTNIQNSVKYVTLITSLVIFTFSGCKKDENSSVTVTDIDGNIYKTVTIGTQTWTIDNLRTTRLNDGTSIPVVSDATAWKNLTTLARCWYNSDSATNNKVYGSLYNWYTVNSGKLAPAGWHVPTQTDWQTLVNFLIQNDPGKIDNPTGGINVEDYIAVYLKEAGTAHWTSSSATATNNFTGFNSLPGGYRDYLSVFSKITQGGYWWTTTSYDDSKAYAFYLLYNSSLDKSDSFSKKYGFSVLLVKD